MQGWIFSTYVAMGSLISLTGLRQIFIQPLPDTWLNLIWFVIQILPLLLLLPGLMSGSLRSTFLLCLASLLYFIHGVMACFDPAIRILGAVEIVFSLALCATTAFLVRRMREAGAELPEPGVEQHESDD